MMPNTGRNLPDSSLDKLTPQRTCAGCGQKTNKADLLRFVYSGQFGSIYDANMKLHGRGIYFCADITCIKKGIKKKVFSRLLRKEKAEPDLSVLLTAIKEGLKDSPC